MANIEMHHGHQGRPFQDHGDHEHEHQRATNRTMLPYVGITGIALALLTWLLSGYPGEDHAGVRVNHHATQSTHGAAAGGHGAGAGGAHGATPSPQSQGVNGSAAIKEYQHSGIDGNRQGSNDGGTHGSTNANAPANNNSGAPKSAEGPY